jgi:hypothetical protein
MTQFYGNDSFHHHNIPFDDGFVGYSSNTRSRDRGGGYGLPVRRIAVTRSGNILEDDVHAKKIIFTFQACLCQLKINQNSSFICRLKSSELLDCTIMRMSLLTSIISFSEMYGYYHFGFRNSSGSLILSLSPSKYP